MIEVVRNSVQTLYNLSEMQKERIKEELTYSNPAYENAIRYSRWGNVWIDPYLFYFLEGEDYLTVPRGYRIPYNYRVVADKDMLYNKNVEYPRFRLGLRNAQREALESYNNKFITFRNGGRESGIITLPTGKGKSILGIALAHKYKQRALVIVQKDDLIDQWKQDCRLALGLRPKQIGLIKAKTYRIGRQITLATIQTLSKIKGDKLRDLQEYFGMIICDEFHHSVAKTYDLINTFPAIHRIGLTATPYRNDGLEGVLYHYFGGTAYVYEEREDDEDIMPVNIKVKTLGEVRWSPPFKTRWNFRKQEEEQIPLKIADIRKAICNSPIVRNIIANDVVAEYIKNKSCLVFFHEKEHVYEFYKMLLRKGVPKGEIQCYIGSKTITKGKGEERYTLTFDIDLPAKEEVRQRAENRDVLITIATLAIATEGTNVKTWERGFLASTINNELEVIQCIGRLRRRKEGKEDVVIYDYRFPNVAGARKHGDNRDDAYRKHKFNFKYVR